MPYSPPVTPSITFNFLGSYTPPVTPSVVIDFALLPDPGGGSGIEQLPGTRILLKEYLYREEAWHPPMRRPFLVEDFDLGNVGLSFTRQAMWTKYAEPEWFPPRRRVIGIPRLGLRSRKAAQIIG